jgi:hypothetical protein
LGVLASPWTQARRLPGADAYEWFPIARSNERLAAGVRAMRVGLLVSIALTLSAAAGTYLGDRAFDAALIHIGAQTLLLPIAATGILVLIDYSRWSVAGRAVPVLLGTAALGAGFVGGSATVAITFIFSVLTLPMLRAMLTSSPAPAGAQQ